MAKRRKILILVPHLSSIGGVQNYYNTLRLEAKENVSYFAVNRLKRQSAVATAIRVIYFYLLFAYRLLKENIELVHVNPSIECKSFYRESVFILIARILNRRTLIFFRGWRNEFEEKIRKSAFKSFLFRLTYARADKYIVLSTLFQKKLIELGVPAKAAFFIETTVADSNFLTDFSLEHKFHSYNEKVVFLFLSRIEKTKGVYIAIDAYRKFLEKHPGRASSLVIAGDGPELPAVKQYVEALNIPQIYFPGRVTSDMKKKVLLESHIMLFPSYTEGLPNTILEGMLYGMPIISRATGGIPDVIQQGVNGFLSESFECSVYESFLSSLAFNVELYKEMACKNHKEAVSNYTTEKVRERMLNIYKTFFN